MSTQKELMAWAAGFWEGEGSIGTYPNTRSVVRRMTVTSTDRDVLERFGAAVGGGTVRRRTPSGHRSGRMGSKAVFEWTLTQWPEIERVARRFLPYLGRRRTEQVYRFLNQLPNGPSPATKL